MGIQFEDHMYLPIDDVVHFSPWLFQIGKLIVTKGHFDMQELKGCMKYM